MLVSTETKKTLDPKAAPKRRSSLLSADLSRQTFLMLIGLEAVILVLIGYFFFVKGVSQEYSAVKADLISRQEELNQLTQRLNNFSTINKLYNSLNPELISKAGSILPSSPDLSNLMVNLDTLVKNNGFSLTGVEFQIVDGKGKEVFRGKNASEAEAAAASLPRELKSVGINLEIKGSSYGGLKNLIVQLENNLRLFDVQKFGFSAESSSLEIGLKSYYF